MYAGLLTVKNYMSVVAPSYTTFHPALLLLASDPDIAPPREHFPQC